jgi:AcrR family transcriptional regulator
MRSAAASRLAAQRPTLPADVVPAGTKGRILEAALSQFASRGFHATSMRDLAHALGLQPGALYVHYASKDHLLAELIRLGHQAHHRGLAEARLRAGSDPRRQLAEVVRAHTRFHAEYAMLAVLIQDELHALSRELGGPALAVRRRSVALIQEILERGVARRRFRIPHVYVATAAIGAMGMRVAHWFKSDFELDAEELADVHAELALRIAGVRR